MRITKLSFFKHVQTSSTILRIMRGPWFNKDSFNDFLFSLINPCEIECEFVSLNIIHKNGDHTYKTAYLDIVRIIRDSEIIFANDLKITIVTETDITDDSRSTTSIYFQDSNVDVTLKIWTSTNQTRAHTRCLELICLAADQQKVSIVLGE